jgi:hypothetical protein
MERSVFFRVENLEAFLEMSDCLRTLFKLVERPDEKTIRAYVFTQQPFYYEHEYQRESEAGEVEKKLLTKGFIKGRFENVRLGK